LKDQLHLYEISKGNFYTGGQYGFVSSHAANFFVLASTFFLVFRKIFSKISAVLFLIALLVCFSRMYLGVHYFTDLIGGAILGTLISFILYKFVWKFVKTPFVKQSR
jgi:undecaprenyl-diphosphatase